MKRLFLMGLAVMMAVLLMVLAIPAMAQDLTSSPPVQFSQSELWDKILVAAAMFVASIIVIVKEWAGARTAEKLADYSDPKVTTQVYDEGFRRGLEHGIRQAKTTADPKDDLFWQSLIDKSGMALVQDETGYHVIAAPPAVTPAPASQSLA